MDKLHIANNRPTSGAFVFVMLSDVGTKLTDKSMYNDLISIIKKELPLRKKKDHTIQMEIENEKNSNTDSKNDNESESSDDNEETSNSDEEEDDDEEQLINVRDDMRDDAAVFND